MYICILDLPSIHSPSDVYSDVYSTVQYSVTSVTNVTNVMSGSAHPSIEKVDTLKLSIIGFSCSLHFTCPQTRSRRKGA